LNPSLEIHFRIIVQFSTCCEFIGHPVE
jgi:hypothetical protein